MLELREIFAGNGCFLLLADLSTTFVVSFPTFSLQEEL